MTKEKKIEKKTAKHLIFQDEISFEKAQKLIDRIDEALLNYSEVILYFATNGGYLEAAKILTKYFNSIAERLSIIVFWRVLSSGVEILKNTTANVYLSEYAYGSIHNVGCDYHTRDLQDKNSAEYLEMEYLAEMNKKDIEFYRQFLTTTEIDRYNNGQTVVLTQERLRQIIKSKDEIQTKPKTT